MKRISLISIILIICLLFSGCGLFSINSLDADTTDAVSEETTAPAEEKSPKIYESNFDSKTAKFLKDLSGNTYEGVVRIAIAGTNVICGDDNTSKVLSDEWAERNAAVEDQLGLSITVACVSAETLKSELKAATLSGTYYSDLIMIPQSQIGPFFLEDVLCNMRSMPGFDMDVDYLFPTATAAGIAGNSVYAVSGYASVCPDSLGCIYFNKELMSTVTDENVYDLVKSGDWTVDKFNNLASSLDASYSVYSSRYVNGYACDLLFVGIGGRYTYSELNNYPGLMMDKDIIKDRVSLTKGMFNNRHYGEAGDAATAYFNSGKSLFLIDKLSMMKTLADSTVEWGVLPLPKINNSDQTSYRSLADSSVAMFFAVPPTATDYEKSADLLSALNIFSYGYNCDAYVNEASYYYLRDSESIETVSTIINTPVFDFAYSYASTVNAIFSDATFGALRGAVLGYSNISDNIDNNVMMFNNACGMMFTVNN